MNKSEEEYYNNKGGCLVLTIKILTVMLIIIILLFTKGYSQDSVTFIDKGVIKTTSVNLYLKNEPQTFKSYIKKRAVSLSLMYVAGACNGQIEVLRHHYPKFKAKHPNINDQFWNPAISHTNKWANGDRANGEKFLFSSTLFVPATDSYHAIRFVERVCIVGAVSIPLCKNERRKKNISRYLIDFSTHWVSYGLGFYTTYGLIYK